MKSEPTQTELLAMSARQLIAIAQEKLPYSKKRRVASHLAVAYHALEEVEWQMRRDRLRILSVATSSSNERSTSSSRKVNR